MNPDDLNAVYEFQGGAFDGWYVIRTLSMKISLFLITNKPGAVLDMPPALFLLGLNLSEVISIFYGKQPY